jgi:mannose-6-phosphate isomerase-like protein (cupin superfamily)
MDTKRTPALDTLVHVTAAREPLGLDAPAGAFVRSATAPGEAMYANRNDKLNIHFGVERLAFPDIQVMDPRMLRIAPGSNNEFHKHAHESIFVVLEGEGEVRVGDRWSPVKTGDVAFVPRWIPHQTRNTSRAQDLVILAITDFGFTSAVLGDYDRRTRLGEQGDDVAAR